MTTIAHRVLLALIVFLFALHPFRLFSPTQLKEQTLVPAELEESWMKLRDHQATHSDYVELYTLFTAPLLHASWAHLIFNCLFLWIFAGLIGELLGTRWMLTLFLLTAFCGSIGDLILRWNSPISSLGVSGAVAGFQGAYLGLAVKWPLRDPYIWPFTHAIEPSRLILLAVLSFGLDISGTITGSGNIAYGSHLGGFLGGLFITSFLVGRPRQLA